MSGEADTIVGGRRAPKRRASSPSRSAKRRAPSTAAKGKPVQVNKNRHGYQFTNKNGKKVVKFYYKVEHVSNGRAGANRGSHTYCGINPSAAAKKAGTNLGKRAQGKNKTLETVVVLREIGHRLGKVHMFKVGYEMKKCDASALDWARREMKSGLTKKIGSGDTKNTPNPVDKHTLKPLRPRATRASRSRSKK